MRRCLLRCLCALVTAAMLLSTCSVAFADRRHFLSYEDITKQELANSTLKYVYTYSLNVYDMPTKESEIREKVGFAKWVIVLEEKKGWAKVMTINDRVGFCYSKQLINTNPNTLNRVVYPQFKEVQVYLRPSVNSPLIGYIDPFEKFKAVAMTPMGDWLRLRNGKYYGYVQRQCMDFEKYDKEKLKDAWVKSDSMKVYYDEKIDSVMGTLYFGQKVKLVSTSGERAKIRSAQGYIGYCDAAALTEKDPNGMNQLLYTQVSGNYLFTSSTDMSGRRNIGVNEQMTLVALDSHKFWARVRYYGQYYYVPYVYLGTEKRLGDYKRLRTSEAAVIREGTKKSSKVVVTVPAGTDLWLLGATDNRAKVTTSSDANGKRYTGYIELKAIS